MVEASAGRNAPSPQESRERTVVGIWLMFVTPENEIFVTTNLKPKSVSQKVPGQINSPAETYDHAQDNGSFTEGTLRRAIKEEVGNVDYNPEEVRLLGFISFDGVGKKVVAVPYLIPVKSKDKLTYNPQEPEDSQSPESENPQWISINNITGDERLTIGEFKVPLFRSPMAEIIEMIRDYQENGLIRIRHVGATIPPEVYEYLNENPSSA